MAKGKTWVLSNLPLKQNKCQLYFFFLKKLNQRFEVKIEFEKWGIFSNGRWEKPQKWNEREEKNREISEKSDLKNIVQSRWVCE